MTTRDRRQARADRLEEWAAQRAAKAEAGRARALELGSVIPFGQPILAGHHSQGRDTRYRARIAGTMDRAFEDGAKARDMASRSAGIHHQLATLIYSDDSDAVEALHARIANLEAQRAAVKAENAAYRKTNGLALRAMSAGQRDHAMPHRGYVLTNLSGNIKRNRDRLAGLLREQE